MAGSKATRYVVAREVVVVAAIQALINQPPIPPPSKKNVANPKVEVDGINVKLAESWILPDFNASNVVLIPKKHDLLATILPSLISKEQKDFIAGRNIKDGICLTSEVINILGNKSFSGNVTLKIDIAKAFDTLNWDFILKTLDCLDLITNYCSNGVRQGDPLSPLLFCLAEDVLSRGLTELVSNNKLNLIQANRNCCVPSHTFFADDIMIFYRGDIKSLNSISSLLKDYDINSGQICNSSKSIIHAGGLSLARHCRLAEIVGFTIAYPPFVYLGFPIFVGKPKAIHFLSLAGKIRMKVASWKAKLLSMAGRVLLVKTIIQSMMVHNIAIYDWPSSVIKSIEASSRNFIWSENVDQNKLVIVSWKKCCSKTTEGGLGIISLNHYNKATNLYLCWQFLNKDKAWSNMLIGEPLACKFNIPEKFHATLTPKVADFWMNNQWTFHDNILLARPNLLASTSGFYISELDKEDTLVWKNLENGILTIKHAYSFLKHAVTEKWDSFPWDIDSAPAHSMICWRLLHNKMPTYENLQLRGFFFPSHYSLCCGHIETSTHLFFECQFAVSIWNWLSAIISLPMPINCFSDCCLVLKKAWNPQARVVVKASLVYTFYLIWQARNLQRFENKSTHWKNYNINIMVRAKLVGNLTKKKNDDCMLSFSFLKCLRVSVEPRVPFTYHGCYKVPSSQWLD
ncbi:uncharacterized protein LOC131630489 [Vicia villosa]|uniref:uncharacterized protein LOC131630489 n=1 Tax=Vicia villosa TaxID=3911 RepID=UPI00273BEBFB|nr:uncharacterized protein LOC131630489 [Vicia villosa]